MITVYPPHNGSKTDTAPSLAPKKGSMERQEVAQALTHSRTIVSSATFFELLDVCSISPVCCFLIQQRVSLFAINPLFLLIIVYPPHSGSKTDTAPSRMPPEKRVYHGKAHKPGALYAGLIL